MQSLLAQDHQAAGMNTTESPTYQCKSGGIPTITNATGHYCVVKGGYVHLLSYSRSDLTDKLSYTQRAKRMDVCCGDSPVNFYPDCYSWCNVDLPPYNGLDPSFQAIRKLLQCLEVDQDPAYTPEILCLNGTTQQRSSSSGTQPALSTSTSQTSAGTAPATTTATSTQPTGSSTSVPGSARRESGISGTIAAGLVLLQVVAGAVM